MHYRQVKLEYGRISQQFYSKYQHSWCPYINSEFYYYSYMQYLHQEKERWWH